MNDTLHYEGFAELQDFLGRFCRAWATGHGTC